MMRCGWWIALVALCLGPGQAVVTLTGDTSRPDLSLFTAAEPVTLTFEVRGLTPADTGLTLRLDLVDEHERPVRQATLPVTTTGDSWRGTYDAPHDRLGFYRVRAKLSNGVTLAPLRSRAAGFLTYAVLPDPAQRPLYPSRETFYGMQGGFSPKVNVLPWLGIRWMLGGYGWNSLEPTKAGEFEAKLATSRANSKPPAGWVVNGRPWVTYPIPTFMMAPKWAVTPETNAYCTGKLTPAGETAWRTYVQAAAKAYGEDHPDLDEHVFQITWEPVYPWGFKGTDEDLIRIYELAYAAIHEVDPKAVVIGPTGGGCGPSDVDWNATLLRKGLVKYLDGFGIHPYHTLPPERNGMVDHLRTIKEAIHQSAGRDLPLFGTEQGYATGEDPGKELFQAQGLIREHLIMMGEGFRVNFGFYICDYPGEPGYGYHYNLNPKIDWGTDKIGPKPISPAFAFQTFLLEGHRTTGPIEWLGDTALGYGYERGDHVVLAVWDWGDAPRAVKLPVGVEQVTVYDWMGNPTATAAPGGTLALTLGPDPQYVVGVAPALWGSRAEKPVQLAANRWVGYPGGTVTVAGDVPAAAATVRCEVDRRLGDGPAPVTVLPGAGRTPFSFAVPIPPDSEPGTYPLRVVLTRPDGGAGVAGGMLRLRPPVTLRRVEPARVDGGWGVRVRLADATGQPQLGTVTVRLRGEPETTWRGAFEVPAAGETEVLARYPTLDLPPGRVLPAVVTVALAKGYRYEQEFPVNFLFAAAAPTPPALDGELTAWPATPVCTLRGRAAVVRAPQEYRGAADLAANVRLAWDATALYLAADVTDDVFCQEFTGFDSWKGDCLQVGFDLDPGKEDTATGNLLADAGNRRRHTELDLALTKNGPEAYRTITFDPAKLPVRLLSADELRLMVSRRPGRLVYQAALPWATLGLPQPPLAGTRLGFALTVNDSDDPKQLEPKALGLFGGITPAKDPRQFGVVVLEGRR